MTWILTRSGKRFDLQSPSAKMVDAADIAYSLGQLCRFNGHTGAFYSVAQHSIIVADLVPAEHQLQALLHDAAEAYVGDMASPLKKMLPEYRQIELRVWHAICAHFHIEPELAPCVQDADLIALATERRDLMPAHPDAWECLAGTQPMAARITPWSPTEATTHFHYRLLDLLATTHRARAAA
ncbi:phosphohydrolase [Pseudomonas sp. JS3066]|uniref:phosphohydrolase n=1 Tax=Pseudomonas sp. JS3066 TaxID=3090665 RepID=UPI002E7BC9B8|nr:phosphohydrolase [Pseudomonas sp. JS3066]WVK93813.1 phosphohydrolase [Pseudomonas sp. JS3066]